MQQAFDEAGLVFPSSVHDTESASGDGVSALSDSQRTFTDTSTVWGPGTVSGRAILALGEAAIRGIDALIIRRRLATIRLRAPRLTAPMCKDLLEFCRPNMYSVRISEQAIRLTLRQICGSRKDAAYPFVVQLCQWPPGEARLIMLKLVYSIPGFYPAPAFKFGVERMCDFLMAVVQLKARWRALILEAVMVLNHIYSPLGIHPICTIANEISSGHAQSPLSSLQESHSAGMRSAIWISLQKCGFPLQDRLKGIERTLHRNQQITVAQFVDAFSDIAILLGPLFGSDIHHAALETLKTIPATRWLAIYEQFSMEVGSEHMYAFPYPVFALSARYYSTPDSARTVNFLRKTAMYLAHDMIEDLLKYL
ncbi:hypothetical protein R3P38DRAFT_3619402 [Favolaschia claudopus]|uniref:Uncharacterized protein n=1 Tax=Favolaschia claudopus TaxID=2862362 RepID=A0AAW0D770_9AGAR